MLDALDITEAEAAGLSELAALDLAMARHYAARAQAEADPEISNQFGRSYQRMARSYRQTLALKAKLKRDVAEAAREHPPARDPVRVADRLETIREPLYRVVWTEYEPPEGCGYDDELGIRLDIVEDHIQGAAEKDPAFGTTPLDAHVVQLAAEIGLPLELARRWRELAELPEAAFTAWQQARFEGGGSILGPLDGPWSDTS
jgi:hypothetical protein